LKKLCTWFELNVHFRFTHLLLSCLNREREGWLIARFFLFALLKVQNGMFLFMMVMPCSTLNWKLLLEIIYIYILVFCVWSSSFSMDMDIAGHRLSRHIDVTLLHLLKRLGFFFLLLLVQFTDMILRCSIEEWLWSFVY
jgi:hypothetical protein